VQDPALTKIRNGRTCRSTAWPILVRALAGARRAGALHARAWFSVILYVQPIRTAAVTRAVRSAGLVVQSQPIRRESGPAVCCGAVRRPNHELLDGPWLIEIVRAVPRTALNLVALMGVAIVPVGQQKGLSSSGYNFRNCGWTGTAGFD
jgi:hypothetical protein